MIKALLEKHREYQRKPQSGVRKAVQKGNFEEKRREEHRGGGGGEENGAHGEICFCFLYFITYLHSF